jgi:hypothetical protein
MFFKSYIVVRHNSEELDIFQDLFNEQQWNMEGIHQVSRFITSSVFEAVIKSPQKGIQDV